MTIAIHIRHLLSFHFLNQYSIQNVYIPEVRQPSIPEVRQPPILEVRQPPILEVRQPPQ